MIQKSLKVDFETWKKLKFLSYELDETMTIILEELVNEKLRKEGLEKKFNS